MKLTIYVPTRGRIYKQKTMKSFHLQQVAKKTAVAFVVPRCEVLEFKAEYPWAKVMVVPDEFKTGSINQAIVERKDTRHKIIVDDDLSLGRRQDPLAVSQKGSSVKTPRGVFDLLKKIQRWFARGYVHGGVSMQNANHYVVGVDHKENTRACGLMFFDSDILCAEGVRFDAVQEHQALHVTLSMLELGFLNVVDYEFMFGHAGTNAEGGCSCYRSVEYLETQNRLLQTLHPTGVSLFYRKLKGTSAKAITGKDGIPAVRVGWVKSVGILSAKRKTRKVGLKCIG